MAMYLWQYPLTPELYTQLCESEDLNGQLQDKYFGENGTMKPTDADLLSYIQNDRKLYSVKHILLLTQDRRPESPWTRLPRRRRRPRRRICSASCGRAATPPPCSTS